MRYKLRSSSKNDAASMSAEEKSSSCDYKAVPGTSKGKLWLFLCFYQIYHSSSIINVKFKFQNLKKDHYWGQASMLISMWR